MSAYLVDNAHIDYNGLNSGSLVYGLTFGLSPYATGIISNTGTLQFFVNNSTTPRIYINPTGLVGINNTSPNATLDIIGTIKVSSLANTTSSTYYLQANATGDISYTTATPITGITSGGSTPANATIDITGTNPINVDLFAQPLINISNNPFTFPTISVNAYGIITSISSGTAGIASIVAGTGIIATTSSSTSTISLNPIYTFTTTPAPATLASVTVDQYGRVTALTSGTAVTSIVADLTTSPLSFSPTTGAVIATFATQFTTIPSATPYATVTVNKYGIVTSLIAGAQPITTINVDTTEFTFTNTSPGVYSLSLNAISPALNTAPYNYPSSITVNPYGQITAISSFTSSPLLQLGNSFGTAYSYGSKDNFLVRQIVNNIPVMESYPGGNFSFSPTGSDPGSKLYYAITGATIPTTTSTTTSSVQNYSYTGSGSVLGTFNNWYNNAILSLASSSNIVNGISNNNNVTVINTGTSLTQFSGILNNTSAYGIAVTNIYGIQNILSTNNSINISGNMIGEYIQLNYLNSSVVTNAYGVYVTLATSTPVSTASITNLYMLYMDTLPTTGIAVAKSYGIYQNNSLYNVLGGYVSVGANFTTFSNPSNALDVQNDTIRVRGFITTGSANGGQVVCNTSGVFSKVTLSPSGTFTNATVVVDPLGYITSISSASAPPITSITLTSPIVNLSTIPGTYNIGAPTALVQGGNAFFVGVSTTPAPYVYGSLNTYVRLITNGVPVVDYYPGGNISYTPTGTDPGYKLSYNITGLTQASSTNISNPTSNAIQNYIAAVANVDAANAVTNITHLYYSTTFTPVPAISFAGFYGGYQYLTSIPGGTINGTSFNMKNSTSFNTTVSVIAKYSNFLNIITSGQILPTTGPQSSFNTIYCHDTEYSGYGSITTLYGHYISLNHSSTVTTQAFIYMDSFGIGTISNSYGIYQNNSANNVLGGFLTVGASVTPTYVLDLQGLTAATNTIRIKNFGTGFVYSTNGVFGLSSAGNTPVVSITSLPVAVTYNPGPPVVNGSAASPIVASTTAGATTLTFSNSGVIPLSSVNTGILTASYSTPMNFVVNQFGIISSATNYTYLDIVGSNLSSSTGTISIATDIVTGITTVTGGLTSFLAAMVGGVLVLPPVTSFINGGSAIITAVASATSLTIGTSVYSTAYSTSSSYVIYYGKSYADYQGALSLSQQPLYLGNALYDSTYSPGTANQVLLSTVTGVKWASASSTQYINSLGTISLPIVANVVSGALNISAPTALIEGGNAFINGSVAAPYVFGSTNDTYVQMIAGVAKTVAMTAYPSGNIQFYPTTTYTDPGSILSYNVNTISPIIASSYSAQSYTTNLSYGTTSTASFNSVYYNTTFAVSTTSINSTFSGINNNVSISGASVLNTYGLNNSVTTTGITITSVALDNLVSTNTTSTISNSYGINYQQKNTSTSITSAYGISIGVNNTTNTIISTLYQLYLGPTTNDGTSSITTNYGVYQYNQGINAFGGSMSIGAYTSSTTPLTIPSYTLDIISGTIRVVGFELALAPTRYVTCDANGAFSVTSISANPISSITSLPVAVTYNPGPPVVNGSAASPIVASTTAGATTLTFSNSGVISQANLNSNLTLSYNSPIDITVDQFGLVKSMYQSTYLDLIGSTSTYNTGSVTVSGSTVSGGGSTSFPAGLVGGIIVFLGSFGTTYPNGGSAIIIAESTATPVTLTIDTAAYNTYSGTYMIYYGKSYIDYQGSLSTTQPLYLNSSLYDSTISPGIAGSFLTSTGSGIAWTTGSATLGNFLLQGGNSFTGTTPYVYGSLNNGNVRLITNGSAGGILPHVAMVTFPSKNIQFSPTPYISPATDYTDPGYLLSYNITQAVSPYVPLQNYTLNVNNISGSSGSSHTQYVTTITPANSYAGGFNGYSFLTSILGNGTAGAITTNANYAGTINTATFGSGITLSNTSQFVITSNIVPSTSTSTGNSLGNLILEQNTYAGAGASVNTLYGQYINLNHTSIVTTQAFIYMAFFGATPTNSFGIYQNNKAPNVFGGYLAVNTSTGGNVGGPSGTDIKTVNIPGNAIDVFNDTIRVRSFGTNPYGGYVVNDLNGVFSSLSLIPNRTYSSPMSITTNLNGVISSISNDKYIDLINSQQGSSVGTISVSGTTVTGTGTFFTPSMVGGTLDIFTLGIAILITGYTSPTSITIATSATVTNSLYEVVFGYFTYTGVTVSGNTISQPASATSPFISQMVGGLVAIVDTITSADVGSAIITAFTAGSPNKITIDSSIYSSAISVNIRIYYGRTYVDYQGSISTNQGLHLNQSPVYDSTNSVGTVGQVLSSNGSATQWVTPATTLINSFYAYTAGSTNISTNIATPVALTAGPYTSPYISISSGNISFAPGTYMIDINVNYMFSSSSGPSLYLTLALVSGTSGTFYGNSSTYGTNSPITISTGSPLTPGSYTAILFELNTLLSTTSIATVYSINFNQTNGILYTLSNFSGVDVKIIKVA